MKRCTQHVLLAVLVMCGFDRLQIAQGSQNWKPEDSCSATDLPESARSAISDSDLCRKSTMKLTGRAASPIVYVPGLFASNLLVEVADFRHKVCPSVGKFVVGPTTHYPYAHYHKLFLIQRAV